MHRVGRRIRHLVLLAVMASLVVGCGGTPAAPPVAPVLELQVEDVKIFRFTWTEAVAEAGYRLLEDRDGESGFVQIATLPRDATSLALEVFLPSRVNARYRLQACNAAGCSDSPVVAVSGSLVEAIGFVKASNTDAGDRFGASLALSADGTTLAVGAPSEGSSAPGIDGDQDDDALQSAGAVYVFVRTAAGAWSQQAYVKPLHPWTLGRFGHAVALSADGGTLAVGSNRESSPAVGIDGDVAGAIVTNSGAAHVFRRTGAVWSQEVYLKASNAGAGAQFGSSVALSSDGDTLAIGAIRERSAAIGVDADQSDTSIDFAGAVYVFARAGSAWSQQAYVKASNTGAGDRFGSSVALSGAGDVLAVGAPEEASSATGIDGDQSDDSVPAAGAVYVFARTDGAWSQEAYVKATEINEEGLFGATVALSADGATLAVGASGESSAATGVDGDQTDASARYAGAVYVLSRDADGLAHQAYLKAFNTEAGAEFGAQFGYAVALSADGARLAVGAPFENGGASGIDADETDTTAASAGAAYVFDRSAGGTWSRGGYVKASNTSSNRFYGFAVALAADGATLAVGAPLDASGAVGVGGDQADDSAPASGGVYLY